MFRVTHFTQKREYKTTDRVLDKNLNNFDEKVKENLLSWKNIL
jgi:hypothetical protein